MIHAASDLTVWTAPRAYGGDDRLDVSRAGGHPRGIAFAPSWALLRPYKDKQHAGRITPVVWAQYRAAYLAEMDASRVTYPDAWSWLYTQGVVTLCCYCINATHCHRYVLAQLLTSCGAAYQGERPSRGD